MATSSKGRSSGKGGSRRDDFSAKVLMILYKRAGGKCCRCGAATFGPDTNPHKSVNIGQGAHIAAAAPLGPRYDEKMSPEERSSATNGMWLCSNCHDIIDRDVKEYPTAKLKKMKKEAEDYARREVGVSRDHHSRDQEGTLTSGVSAATIVEIRKHKSTLAQLNDNKISSDEGQDYLDKVDFIDFEKDQYLPDVGRELIAYLQQLVVSCEDASVQMEVIRRLKSMCDAFLTQFTKEDVEQVTTVVRIMVERVKTKKRSKLYQSTVALLKDMAVNFKAKGIQFVLRKELREPMFREETDTEPPPNKLAKLEGEDEQQKIEDRYLDFMEELSVCTDIEKALSLEAKLQEMGYEPNIA